VVLLSSKCRGARGSLPLVVDWQIWQQSGYTSNDRFGSKAVIPACPLSARSGHSRANVWDETRDPACRGTSCRL